MKIKLTLLLLFITGLAIGQMNDASLKTQSETEIGGKTYSPARAQAMFDEIIDAKVNITHGIATSGTNTYTGTKAGLEAYAANQFFVVRFINANTGAVTLNINGLGAVSVRKNVSENLTSGDILAGQAYVLVHDGTNFQITGAVGSGEGGATSFLDLTDTPSSYEYNEGAVLSVNGTGDGLEFTYIDNPYWILGQNQIPVADGSGSVNPNNNLKFEANDGGLSWRSVAIGNNLRRTKQIQIANNSSPLSGIGGYESYLFGSDFWSPELIRTSFYKDTDTNGAVLWQLQSEGAGYGLQNVFKLSLTGGGPGYVPFPTAQLYGPLKLMNYTSGVLPDASSFPYGLVYDQTNNQVKVSNGSTWSSVLSGAFTGLSDVPSSYSGQGGKILAVTDEEDALEFIDVPSDITIVGSEDEILRYGSPTTLLGTSIFNSDANGGLVLGPNLSAPIRNIVASGTVEDVELLLRSKGSAPLTLQGGSINLQGDSVFISSLPTPNNSLPYVLGWDDDDGGKVVPIEVSSLGGGGGGGAEDFTDLGDVPSSYTGQEGKFLAVNGSGDGIEFVDAPSGGGITNGAANNELMKSNGTNAVSSGLFSPASGELSTTTGSLTLNSSNGYYGLGNASNAVNERVFVATGTESNIGVQMHVKGTGEFTFGADVAAFHSRTHTGQWVRIKHDATNKSTISPRSTYSGAPGNASDLFIQAGDAYSGTAGDLVLSPGVDVNSTANGGDLILDQKDGDIIIEQDLTEDDDIDEILVRDPSTGAVKYRTASSLGGGGGSGTVTSVSGTTDRIVVTNGTSTPSIDISSSYVGQSSITTTGTLTSGATGSGFTVNLGSSTVSGTLPVANFTPQYVLDRASSSTSGSTITLDLNSQKERIFVGSASFSSAKTLALSNTTNALVFNFHFEVTNTAAVLTCPNTFLMVDENWNGTSDQWTPPATGKYEMGGVYDGTNWKVKVVGPYN